MLLDDKYNQLERLLKEYPIDSDEYKRISLLMFGYTDEEIDEKMYKPAWSRHEYNCIEGYCDCDDEPVNDYKDICSIPIMTDEYYFERFNGFNNDMSENANYDLFSRTKIMTDNYINLNNKGGVDVK